MGFIIGLFFGVIVGSATGLMLAPQSGGETLRAIQDRLCKQQANNGTS